jgi:hypothetical membrane protein
LAGAIALMGIITAEALYPEGYSTSQSMISDLGGTEPPEGRVEQPSAAVFDGAMIVGGALIVAAALVTCGALRRHAFGVFVALLGVGMLGVGVFPGDTGVPHAVFAQLTFFSGGVAAILSVRVMAAPLRWAAVVLGVVALANLILYMFLGDAYFVAGLGVGGLERWVAYPILLWMLGCGGYLSARGARAGLAGRSASEKGESDV